MAGWLIDLHGCDTKMVCWGHVNLKAISYCTDFPESIADIAFTSSPLRAASPSDKSFNGYEPC